jgi:hypothetical protein
MECPNCGNKDLEKFFSVRPICWGSAKIREENENKFFDMVFCAICDRNFERPLKLEEKDKEEILRIRASVRRRR